MGNLLEIFGSPVYQANLYDSTNGRLCLGALGDTVEIIQEALTYPLNDGNTIMGKQIAKISIPALETDSARVTAIKNRRGYPQELYLIGDQWAVKLLNVHLSYGLSRSGKMGEPHKLDLKAQTIVHTYVKHLINALGSIGNMNTDGGGGLATGWTNSGCSSLSIQTSYLGAGYGNSQRFSITGASQALYADIRFPLEQSKPIRITVSAYIDNRKAGTSTFRIGFRTVNSSSVVVDTSETVTNIANGADGRYSHSAIITPGADVLTIRAGFFSDGTNTAQLDVDNVQVEFGELSPYSETV